MKFILKCLLLVCCTIIFSSCTLLEPIVVKYAPIEIYKYVYIKPTQALQSGAGSAFGTIYGAFGFSRNSSVNPTDIIAGVLMKNGFTVLPELKPELVQQTLIVNYGESGREATLLGYTIEITIQFISAYTNELVVVCTAEGWGEIETDAIRIAIHDALSSLFPKDQPDNQPDNQFENQFQNLY